MFETHAVPSGAIATSNGPASVVWLKTHGLMRIAVYEHINAVIPIAGDPDITIGI